MKCRYCGNELKNGERFCRRCGKPVETEPVQSSRFCSECGAELLPNAGFCRSCGAPVNQQKPEQPQQPDAAQTDEKAELKRRTEILVIAAQGGDSESFAKLYELYHQKVFALAKTTVKSDADAEDVLQMTFIKAWDHLDRLKDTSAFSTWIQRITLNQCYSLLRKQHATIPIDNDDEDSEPIQIESDLMLPEVYAEQNDLKKRLGKIIDELSDVQKQTITLYYFDGLPVENIAWIMDCSVNTVKSRLFLARKSIKTEIEEQERKSGQPFYGIVGLATIPFGQFFVAHVKASSLSQTAASALLKAISGKISQSASAAAKAGTSAAAKGAANAGAKTAAAAGTKAAAGAGAKTAAAVGASVSKKVIAGIVAGTLAVGTVAGGTVATVKIVQNNRERKAAESATTVVTDGTVPSVDASDALLPTDMQPVDSAQNGGLSARESEAYRAYLNVLTENRAGIDNYIWQHGYSDFDSETGNLIGLNDSTLTRSVALCDICGDELPELIYIGDVDAGYFDDNGYYCNDLTLYLNILTIRDGRAVSVYRDFWGYGNDDHVIYHLFHVSGDKSLYAFEQIVDDYLGNTYLRFDEAADGTLTPVTVAYLYEDFEDDSPETDEECEYRDESGNNISKQEYQAIVSDLESRVDSVLMYSYLPDSALKNSCLAKTCGEMIAYLSGLLDATAENAYLAEPYRAYRNELTGNKTSIKSYQWYPDCFGVDLVQEPDHLQRAVVLHDLDRDGMPELLYICDQESDEFDIELRILSYRNGKAEPVYTDKSLVGNLGNYAWFQLRGDSDLYCNYREDDVYRDLTGTYTRPYSNEYYKLGSTSSDGWSDPFLSDNEDNIGTSHTYLSDGQEIDRATFEAIERELLAQKEICLMQGWRFKDRSRCPAMTYDEQLAYLNAFLYAVPAQAPASEAPASDADLYAAFSAYLDALLENKEGIDRYIWQQADWYRFIEESEDGSGAFYQSYESDGDDPLPPQPVALYDLNGDSIPELIYIDVKDRNLTFHSESTLHILTYRNGGLVSLYSGKWDRPDTEEWRLELTLSIRPDGMLYRYENNGSTFDSEEQYDVYTDGGDELMYRTLELRSVGHAEDDEDSVLQETFWGSGNQTISEQEYKEREKAFSYSMRLFGWTGNSDLAMTCDEAIAWLRNQLGVIAEAPTPTAAPPNTPTPKPTKTPKPTATPTKKPTATPVQSAGSSSNEREAYQAYIDVLMKNKKAIDSYTWQRGYYGNEYESLTDDNLARPVVICDVCGDSLPELIFYRTEDPNEDHPWVFLTVVTYRDGKAKTIYTDSDEVRDWYDEDDYCYYQQKNDKALRMRYSYGDEDGETLEYYIFSENGNGSLKRKEVSGNKAASSQIGQILMTSFENTHDDPLFEHLAAMTCDEAIAWLRSRLGTVVEAPTPKPTEDEPSGSDCQAAYAAYIDHLTKKKSEIDDYKNVFQDPFSDEPDSEIYAIPRAVLSVDICGDGIPELIYVSAGKYDARFGVINMLNILTWRDGSLETLYCDEWDNPIDWDELHDYYLFADPNAKTLYMFVDSSITEYVMEEYFIFTERANGKLQLNRIMFHEETYDEDSDQSTEVFNLHGKDVSESTFYDEVRRLKSGASYLIPRPTYDGRLSGNQHYLAMTCDEAIACLYEQISKLQ